MARRRLLSLTLVAAGLIASLVTIGLVSFSRSASALPPAGTDTFGVNAQVSITSVLGSETDIPFTGTVTIERDAPHEEGGVEVQDLTITDIVLSGLSATGFVTISESPSVASTGEVRSLDPGDEFPASSFFDINVVAVVPSSGSFTNPPFFLHNETVLHLVPMSNGSEVDLNSWPPFDVKYQQTPDPCTRMLRNVLDPRSQDPWLPAQICVTNISVQLGVAPTPTPTSTPCDGPCPTPTQGPFTPTRTPRPTNTPSPTPTSFGPEDPTFSVAPGGPSGFHPADLLRLGAGGPVTVSGNDDFANAHQITSLPFSVVQSTTGFTIEDGEPLNPDDCITVTPFEKGATAWYRFTAPQGGRMNLDTVGSTFDTVLAVYGGTSLNTLTPVDCNDDGTGLSSEISGMDVTAGTTYYIQAGGFHADVGTLHLAVHPPGGAGAGNADTTVAITCANLGLIGCAQTAPQDDLDALSFGNDTIPDDNPIAFSVAPGSQGVEGSAVGAQAACSPAEQQADEFTSSRNGTNSQVLDGDGQGNECPATFGLGLIERPNSDNLDALDGHRPEYVDEDSDGHLDRALFFSLAAGSPSLNPVGFSPADILWTLGIGTPGLYASASQLGLQAADDIDGLCLVDRGNEQARYDPNIDSVLFSLKAGSPTLAAIRASAADVLAPGPMIRYHAAELGLRSSDDLDAMKCFETSGAQSIKVAVGETQSPPVGFWFCDPMYVNGNACETKIDVGDTVEWNWVGTAPHTVTECGASCPPSQSHTPLFDSGVLTNGGHYEHTFNTPGTYLYVCEVHPSQLGSIIVNGPGGGTPAPTPTRTPTPMGVPGDANKDGTINAIDSALILQRSAGLLPSINPRADANGDGQINSIDASLILQRVAGLLLQWPP